MRTAVSIGDNILWSGHSGILNVTLVRVSSRAKGRRKPISDIFYQHCKFLSGEVRTNKSFLNMAFIRRISSFWLILAIYSVCINIEITPAMRRFRNGRYIHGFLGDPSKRPPLYQLDVKDMWFEQPLDHFDPENIIKWKQRYFVNSENYRNDSNAPVFLMIGGESETTKRWMHEGAWIHYAEHFGALCFQLEHRFYGQSRPTSDLSTKNLFYLTSEQALADLARFVEAMKIEYNLAETQKWIAFGGSYPGSLAAWAREKYPHLIYGSISSSGPLLAKVDFNEYFDVVKDSLASYSTDCVRAVARSFAQAEILLKHMVGQRNIDKIFRTCTPIEQSIDNRLDISTFFENLASNFAGVVQYNKDNSPHATITIDEVCDVMLNSTIGPPVARLARVNDMLLNQTKENCLDYKYDKMITEMKNISWSSKIAEGMRQWTYQTCNEFGFYQTSENQKSPFGDRFKVDYFIRQCMDIYSERMNSKYLEEVVSNTNRLYGALKPNTTNVLYVHGSIDPWHALGLTVTKTHKRPTIFINGTAHCADMYEPNKADPPQLIAARNRIIKYLANLLEASANDWSKKVHLIF